MAESTWTTMHIGGTLPASKIADLVEAIIGDFHEIAEGPNTIDDNRYVSDVANRNESLLVQGQVNYGNPETVIDFCQKNNLPLWLHFDAGPEWDSGIQIWQPGWPDVEQCEASAQGYVPVISLNELESLPEGTNIMDTIENLQRFTSEKVPPLTIVEDAADEQEGAANG
jgi:hypothetical protein